MEISKQPTSENYEEQSLFSVQEFRASQLLLLEKDSAKKMTVGSGRRLSTSLNRSGPLGAFSRILLESSEFANSKQFCYVWKRRDTNWPNRSKFQLTQSEPITCGTESSLLPTPRKEGFDAQGKGHGDLQYEVKHRLWRTPNASMVSGGGQDGEKRMASGHSMQLTDQVLTPAMYPTPTGRDWKDGTAEACKNVPVNGLLGRAVHQLLPTPQAHDAAKGNPERVNRFGTEHGGRNLNDTIGGSLSPRFVEQLMGFPIDHTALKPSEIRWSPNKRIRSSKQSRKSKE